MTVSDRATTGSRGRQRGGPRRIRRADIVEAARTLPPEKMTMQAVADELGVDRKALNYHVVNREGLFRLVAADVFEENFRAVEIESETDWRGALRAWAEAVRAGTVATGALATYYRIDRDDLTVLRPAEAVLASMSGAGFAAETAGRSLIFVTSFAMAAGRDAVLVALPGGHPQGTELRRAFEENADAEGYTSLRGLAAAGLNTAADLDTQFAFEVDLFLGGLERSLGDQ